MGLYAVYGYGVVYAGYAGTGKYGCAGGKEDIGGGAGAENDDVLT